jgi:type I restriction enzyme S subunit
MVRLSELLVEAKPGFACGEVDDHGVFQIRMNNVTRDGRLDLAKRRRVPRHRNRVEDFILRDDDILFNATNSPDLVGKTATFNRCGEPAVYSNHYLRLRSDQRRLLPAYLARWLHMKFEQGQFRAMCRQWVNQATVSQESLLGMRIPLCSVDEQRRIADVLDRTEELRAKRRQALAHLDDLTQSIFLNMFGDPTVNPHEYEVRVLSEWVDPQRPITYGILKPGEHQVDGVRYVRVVDMKDGAVVTLGIRRTTPEIAHQYKRSSLRTNDLLISIRGHVGRLACVPAELDGANITQDSARLALPARSVRYVMACLQSPGIRRWINKRIKGAAVTGINLADVKLIPLPVPPLESQERFADRSVAVERHRNTQRAQMAELDGLFAAVRDRAFAGLL